MKTEHLAYLGKKPILEKAKAQEIANRLGKSLTKLAAELEAKGVTVVPNLGPTDLEGHRRENEVLQERVKDFESEKTVLRGIKDGIWPDRVMIVPLLSVAGSRDR